MGLAILKKDLPSLRTEACRDKLSFLLLYLIVWRHEVLTVILENDKVNLKTTNMLGMTEHRCGEHLDPGWHHCAAELEPVWQPWRGGPQISVQERVCWSVARSAGSWQPPASNNPWQQLSWGQALQEGLASHWAQCDTGTQSFLHNMGLLYGLCFSRVPC